jgi:hypothetical protein
MLSCRYRRCHFLMSELRCQVKDDWTKYIPREEKKIYFPFNQDGTRNYIRQISFTPHQHFLQSNKCWTEIHCGARLFERIPLTECRFLLPYATKAAPVLARANTPDIIQIQRKGRRSTYHFAAWNIVPPKP